MKRTVKGFLIVTLLLLVLTALSVTVCAADDTLQTVTVSGKLVSSSGDAIQLTGNGGTIQFLSSSGGYPTFPSQSTTIHADGTFIATLTYSTTSTPTPGQYYLRYTTDEDNSINVIPDRNFFYKQDGTAPAINYGSATLLDLRDGDISGLELLVETGWVLTGTIKMHEDAYLTGISDGDLANLYFGLRSKGSTSFDLFSDVLFMEKGVRQWSYRAIIPKTPVDCVLMQKNIQLYTAASTAAESNLHTAEVVFADLQITGSMTLPDIILYPAKAIVTARFTVQSDVQTTIQVFAVTENGTYESYFMSSNGYWGGTFEETVTIPYQDTATTYRLYYKVGSDASSLLHPGPVYVKADGNLTPDASQAGNFPIEDAVYPITPIPMEPFAEGRIYIPRYDGSEFTIAVYGKQSKSSSIYALNTIAVGSGTVKKDENGDHYVTYSLAGNKFTAGTSYYLQFIIYYEKGERVRMIWPTGTFYADEDGGLLTPMYAKHHNFTVDAVKTNRLDVELLTWEVGSEKMYLQSGHGIASVSADSNAYTAAYPGATSLKVSFSERTDVDLYINDRKYTASALADKTITVTGDTLNIRCVDKTYSADFLYGFAVIGIEPVYADSAATQNGVVAVYSESGSSKEALLSALAAGNEIRVSLIHTETLTADSLLIAAVYNTNGKLLGMDLAELTFTNQLGTATVSLKPCQGAAEVRLMHLTADGFAPLMQYYPL